MVENVDAYIVELRDRVGSVTVHGSICKLRRAAQFIAPGRDFTWLADIGKDLALEMRPRSKLGRVGHDRGSRRSWADLDPRGGKFATPDRACPSVSGS